MERFEFDALIQRKQFGEKQTLGEFTIYEDRVKPIFDCKTLELEEDKNARRDDCIPRGTYTVVKRNSPKYGDHFHVIDVPDRSYILIHHGNYNRDILGCILVGRKHVDIDGDGLKDVTASKGTMKDLNKLLPNKFTLKII